MSVIEQPGVGRYLAPGSPVDAGVAGAREPVRAPLLGEHNAEVLRTGLGLTDDQIKGLHERGVIASAPHDR